MSREIDMNDPDSWSEDDVRYLAERDRLPKDHDYQLPEPEEIPLEERANTGDANTFGLTKDEHESQTASLADDEDDEGLEPPYGEYTNDELRAELARRELEVGGNKAELIERLEADDEE